MTRSCCAARSTASRSASASLRLPTPEQRLAWLADHLAEQPGSGIVYCLTVAATQQIADYLRARGHHVAAYSGQTEPTERLALEDALAAGRVKALVATSALGMGFDATLGFVVNLGAPQSPVAYYQQVGRAGRGTDRASVVLLPQQEDKDIWAYFASLAFPREDQVRHTLRVLAEEGRREHGRPRDLVDLGRTRLEQMLKVLDVDGAVRRVRGGWEATGAALDLRRRALRAGQPRHASASSSAMLDYLDTDRCRMWFLRDQLDDPDVDGTTRCGRCDPCGGVTLSTAVPTTLSARHAPGWRDPASSSSRAAMWPTALANLGLDLKGRIGEGAEPGRAVARLTDLGHGQTLRDLFARAADRPAACPTSLVRAVIEVLQRLAARTSTASSSSSPRLGRR